MTGIIEFDVNYFRLNFPAYSDSVKYPDAFILNYWDQAISYISNLNYGALRNSSRQLALNLMTAHLINLNDASNQLGITPYNGLPTLPESSKVGNVDNKYKTPPVDTEYFDWFLNLTPYGQQLLALLKIKSVGGFYVGGSPEGAGFRKVYGVFY